MPYFDVICAIWHQMMHMTPNDTYNIKIWHQSIWPISVCKEAYGPHQSHLLIQIWLTNYFRIKHSKNASERFFLCKFWKSFVFLQSENRKWKSRFRNNVFREMFLTFIFSWKYTWSEILKTVKEFILCLSGGSAFEQRLLM